MSVLPRKKQSSWDAQEEPEVLQAGQDQATPGSELGVLPSRVPAAHEGLQQQRSGKENEDQQGRQQNPGMVEGQAPESCQVTSVTWAGGHGQLMGETKEHPRGRHSGALLSVPWRCQAHCLCRSLG